MHVRLGSSVVAAALALGCHTAPPEPPPPRPLAGALLVGCSELLAHGARWACELEPGSAEPSSLRVWLPPGPSPRVLVDGEDVPPTQVRERGGGILLDVTVPPGAALLLVERDRSDEPPTVEQWSLALRWRDPEREPLPLDAAKAAMLEAFAEERWDDCEREATRVRTLAHEAGRGLTELRALQNAILCSSERGDAEALLASAAALEQLPAASDERDVARAYLRGVVRLRQGALHDAIAALREGLVLSERLGMTSRHAEHLSMLSLALAELGDVDGAVRAAQAALDRRAHPFVHPCEDAALRTNLAWVSMLGVEAGLAASVPDPETELRAALAAFEGEQAGCAHEEAAANVGLELARAALLRRDPAEAERWLARVDEPIARAGNPHLQAELRLVRAELHLGAGRLAQAREALAAGPAEREALPPDLQTRQWIVEGELAEREGDLQAAERLYRRAHALPLEQVRRLAHDDGHLRFLYDRLRGSQRLVELLAGPRRDPAAALQVAREAAGREARLLAQRRRAVHQGALDPVRETARREYLALRDRVEDVLEERWDLDLDVRLALRERTRPHERARLDALLGPGSEDAGAAAPTATLRTPGPGELLLAYFPMPGGARRGFAADEHGVRVLELPVPPEPLEPRAGEDPAAWRQAWAEALLVPFAAAIDRAERVTVLPSFGLELLPFHAMPWHGRPLLAHVAVRHGVDLPIALAAERPAPDEPTATGSDARGLALVVGDPRGDLADARLEAEQVAAALAGRGLTVQTLIGHDAGGIAVRAALPRAALLHYAGHAATAGAFGWESTLGLAAHSRLEVGDLFALERVPAQVVLTACRGGGQAVGPRERGISLAEAFVIAGARAVVAASIDLDAAEVSSFGALVHQGPVPDLAHAYRDAMLRWHAQTGTSATWQSLRLWVP